MPERIRKPIKVRNSFWLALLPGETIPTTATT